MLINLSNPHNSLTNKCHYDIGVNDFSSENKHSLCTQSFLYQGSQPPSVCIRWRLRRLERQEASIGKEGRLLGAHGGWWPGEAGVRSVGAGHLMALIWGGFRLSLVGPPSTSRTGGIRNGEVENHRPGPDCSVLMAVEAMFSFAELWLSEVVGQHCCTIVHFCIPCLTHPCYRR